MLLKRLLKDRAGSMATIFAIGSTTLLLGIGAAVEVNMLVKKKDLLQDAADSAVLAAAVSGETDKRELQLIAQKSAETNLDGAFVLNLKSQGANGEITVDLTSDHEMILMGMFGHSTRPVSVMAASEAGTGGKLNIALALDTTGSMAGSRMTTMIEAATDLVDSVEMADKGQGNAKISLIPFADYVRIDPSFEGEEWIDVQPEHESTWDVLDWDSSTNCRVVGSGETAYTECDNYVFEQQTATVSWVGCMASRTDGLHRNAAYDGSPFKGPAGHSDCNAENNIMTPLTDDYSQLIQDIEAYQPKGKTYLPVGLQWAWRSLVEQGLFTDDTIDENEPVQQVLLLMTDGSNTTSLNGENQVDDGWEGLFHYGVYDEDRDRALADALTLEMCASVKAADIRLITVAYEVEDEDTRNLLKTCASVNSDFYDARNASKLKQAFGKIGSGFSTARLTR